MKRLSHLLFSSLVILSITGAGCNTVSEVQQDQAEVSSLIPNQAQALPEERGTFIGERDDDPGLEYPLEIIDYDEIPAKAEVVTYNEGIQLEIDQRKREQFLTQSQFEIFMDFSFQERREQTGIDFRHRIVDDAGIGFNFNHYDHGNGLAIADVDGDGLFDVYFVTQIGENQLWKNNGDGTFSNITREAGVGLGRKVSISAAFADIDNDGDADLYVTTVKHGNVLFENGGEGVFRNISEYSGTKYYGHSSSAVFFDYDLDGLLDLFLVNVGGYTKDEMGNNGYFVGNPAAFQHIIIDAYTEESVLYKNLGENRFEDVTKKMNLVDHSWSGDASIVDFNNDRYPDLYLLSMEGEDHYYENQGGKKFVDRTGDYFAATSSGAMGIKFFDFDNDLDMDLYVTDMHSDMGFELYMDSIEKEKLKSNEVTDWIINDEGSVVYGNTFFRNDGGEMNEVSAEYNLENYWPWGVSVADINADGYQDIFVTSSMNYLYKYTPNLLLMNNNGQSFLASQYLLGIEPRAGGEIEKIWFHLDCERRNKEHLECKDRTGEKTVERGAEVTVMGSLGSRSSVVYDFDGDGDLDIITNEFNDEPLVYLNNLSDQKQVNYVEVLLEGTESNRDGIGSFITVYAGDQVYKQYHDGASGYLSHSRMSLYFGLGDQEAIEKIVVDWPSGKQTVHADAEIRSRVLIMED